MALNSSGPISLGGSTVGESVALELGLQPTGQISLDDAVVRTLLGKPTQYSEISLLDGRGKSNLPPFNFISGYSTVFQGQINLNVAGYERSESNQPQYWFGSSIVGSEPTVIVDDITYTIKRCIYHSNYRALSVIIVPMPINFRTVTIRNSLGTSFTIDFLAEPTIIDIYLANNTGQYNRENPAASGGANISATGYSYGGALMTLSPAGDAGFPNYGYGQYGLNFFYTPDYRMSLSFTKNVGRFAQYKRFNGPKNTVGYKYGFIGHSLDGSFGGGNSSIQPPLLGSYEDLIYFNGNVFKLYSCFWVYNYNSLIPNEYGYRGNEFVLRTSIAISFNSVTISCNGNNLTLYQSAAVINPAVLYGGPGYSHSASDASQGRVWLWGGVTSHPFVHNQPFTVTFA